MSQSPGQRCSLEQGCGLTFGGLDLGMGLGISASLGPEVRASSGSSKCPETGREKTLTRSFCFSVRRLLSSSLSYSVTRTFLSQSRMRRGNSVSSESRQGGMSRVNTQGWSAQTLTPCPRANVLARSLSPPPPFSCYCFSQWPWHRAQPLGATVSSYLLNKGDWRGWGENTLQLDKSKGTSPVPLTLISSGAGEMVCSRDSCFSGCWALKTEARTHHDDVDP